jgi:hypothetical protein
MTVGDSTAGDPQTFPEVQELLGDIRRELPALSASVRGLSDRLHRSRRFTITLGVAVGLTMILLVLLTTFVWRTHNNFDCVRNWANATSARSDRLAQSNIDRLNAEDQLLVSQINLWSTIPTVPGRMIDPAKFRIALVDLQKEGISYRKAKAQYDKVVAENPVPTSYQCNSL